MKSIVPPCSYNGSQFEVLQLYIELAEQNVTRKALAKTEEEFSL